MSSDTKRIRFEEGYNLDGGKFYTAWAKLKELCIDDKEDENKQLGGDKKQDLVDAKVKEDNQLMSNPQSKTSPAFDVPKTNF